MDTQQLRCYISEKRPSLSPSSVNTYASILRSLHKRAFGTVDFDPENVEKHQVILDCLKDTPPGKRKTTLSALVICTDKKQYRDLMMSDIKDYKETISSAHHAYPCTASMEKDAQIGDTILHEAGYIIRKSVEEAME